MNTSLREMLARQANDAELPNLDIEELVGLGEAQLRRRRIAAVAGSAAVAAVVVIALALGATLKSPVERGDGPVDRPSPSPTEPHAEPVRKLLYIDVPLTGNGLGRGVIHFGDLAIEAGNAVVHTDVTDDGFVYTSVAGVQFSDGGRTEQIGSRLCVHGNGVGHHMAQDAVMTGAAGSLVAWFACADPESPESPTLVVYDTGSGREVVRQPMPICDAVAGCHLGLDQVVGEHIYFTRDHVINGRDRSDHFSYDVTTGRQDPATSRSYAADIRSQPRGLVVGDTWQTGTATEGIGATFRVFGSRLVPQLRFNNDWHLAKAAFDTATGQAFQLRLPTGYHADGATFSVFEWLDDNTVALTPDHNLTSADIITCRLSDARCRLTVKAGPDDLVRIVPHRSLPG